MNNNGDFSVKTKRDIDIIEKALHGDENAYSELLKLYKDPIYYFLWKKIRNKNDANDLTMETFSKAFNNLTQYSSNYPFSTWLFRIAINSYIDFIRRKKNTINYVDSDINFNDPSNHNFTCNTPNPEDLLIESQNINELHNMIMSLKPMYTKLILLRYCDELSYEEISTKTNIPITTIKTRLHNARKILASQIMQKNKA